MSLTKSGAWIELLTADRIEEFNERARSEAPDLQNADLRMADLRRVDVRRANLRGAYLRGADLRGVDLSEANLDGASINEARISGTLFPRSISADEITLSVWKGTRMRAGGRSLG
jgi:uncharacterized protein YjbI with pentapeptide repeats